jgi:hypothetical protein
MPLKQKKTVVVIKFQPVNKNNKLKIICYSNYLIKCYITLPTLTVIVVENIVSSVCNQGVHLIYESS